MRKIEIGHPFLQFNQSLQQPTVIERQFSTLEQQYSTLQQQYASLQHKYSTLEQQYFPLDQKHSALQTEVESLRAQHITISEDHTVLKKQHAHESSQLSTLQEECAALREKAKGFEHIYSHTGINEFRELLKLLNPSQVETLNTTTEFNVDDFEKNLNSTLVQAAKQFCSDSSVVLNNSIEKVMQHLSSTIQLRKDDQVKITQILANSNAPDHITSTVMNVIQEEVNNKHALVGEWEQFLGHYKLFEDQQSKEDDDDSIEGAVDDQEEALKASELGGSEESFVEEHAVVKQQDL